MTAATAADWLRFLRPVASSVRNPPSEADARGRASALAFTMAHVPASALTESKARDLCRKSEFWPSVAEIEAIFAAEWKEQARSRAITSGLTRLAAPEVTPPTPGQRKASAEAAMRVAAELRSTQAIARPKAEARPLTAPQLLATYEALAAQGNQAAETRARAIKSALGR